MRRTRLRPAELGNYVHNNHTTPPSKPAMITWQSLDERKYSRYGLVTSHDNHEIDVNIQIMDRWASKSKYFVCFWVCLYKTSLTMDVSRHVKIMMWTKAFKLWAVELVNKLKYCVCFHQRSLTMNVSRHAKIMMWTKTFKLWTVELVNQRYYVCTLQAYHPSLSTVNRQVTWQDER